MKVKHLVTMLRGLEDFDLKDCGLTTEILDSLDAEPIKHGYWTEHPWADEEYGRLISNYECSICKDWSKEEFDYCPYCGAKMDKE